MQELSRQLGNNLPNALEAGARAMNVTTQEFIKMIQTGQVASKDFIIPFARELRKMATANDALASGKEKLVAQQMRLNTAFKEMIHDIFQAGVARTIGQFFNMIASGIRAITPRLTETTAAASSAASALMSLVDAMASLVSTGSGMNAEGSAWLKAWHSLLSTWYEGVSVLNMLAAAMYGLGEIAENMWDKVAKVIPGVPGMDAMRRAFGSDHAMNPNRFLPAVGGPATMPLKMFSQISSGFGRIDGERNVSIGKIEVNTRSTDPRQTGVEVASQVANFLNMGY